MKIVHLLPSIDFGGTERILLTLARAQQESGNDVFIITFTENNGYLELSEELNIIHLAPVDIYWKWHKTIATNLDFLQDKLNEIKPNIIHSHSFWTELMLYSLPKIKEASYISHFHLFYPFYEKKPFFQSIGHQYIFKRLCKRYKTFGTKFIAVSNAVKKYYSNSFPKHLRDKIYVIPNGIDLNLYQKNRCEKNEVLTLLSVGRLVKDKNYDFLLSLASILMTNQVDFQWNIAGEGAEKEQLISKIKQLKLENNVFLLGQVSDLHYYYKRSHLLIHTSFSETFGLVFLEAMASGLPSVSFKAGGNEEFITDSKEGVLLEHTASREKFAAQILEVFKNKKQYDFMVDNCLEKAKKYSLNSYYQNIQSLYLSK